ncbi:myb-like protein V [Physella acuta]|uniref:myb-like protein V n=1 Tax=Physella acuta TaxID=109671 RepID=UPI0027DD28A7|nr:myb-like protein V [Physella acuta]
MAMNYIGSVSILDRGDAPAQAVIDRNARSLAQRICDETKDELNKVMTRVHSIYGAMDTVDDRYTITSMEYVNDLYQQQVTIFIVGYSETCQQKLRLLQQVNQFFTENSKNIDEEDWFPTTPDMDLEEASNTVEDTLSHAHELSRKLAELNREMVSYMASSIEKKASNKGRKKIERALQQAREEVSGLNEKLTALQKDLDEKDEKVHNFLKQMESKNLEVQKYRTAAELAKTATDELDALRKEIQQKDAKIISQRQQLAKQEVELTQVNHIKEKTDLSLTEEFQQKITILQKELDDQKKTNEEIKKEMTRLLDNQMQALHETHRQEMEELRHQHETEAMKLQGLPEPATGHVTLSEPALVRENRNLAPETRTPTKNPKKGFQTKNPNHESRTPTKNPDQEPRPRTPTKNPDQEPRPRTSTMNPYQEPRPRTPTKNLDHEPLPRTPTMNPYQEPRPRTPTKNPDQETRPSTPTKNPDQEPRPRTPTKNPDQEPRP